MSTKKFVQLFLLTVIVLASFANANQVFAGGVGNCGGSYIVQQGDTLWSLANQCGISVDALRAANPNLGYGNLTVGATIVLPGSSDGNGNGYYGNGNGNGNGYYGNGNGNGNGYYGNGNDTGNYGNGNGNGNGYYGNDNGNGNRNGDGYGNNSYGNGYGYGYGNNSYGNGYGYGVSCYGNGYGNGYAPASYSNSYAGGAGGTYVVQWGDTLRKIADRTNVNLNDLIAANPRLWNPNLIYAGEVIRLPGSASTYCVQRGDTLRIIAARFGTTVYNLQSLNQLWNPNLIYAGQIIRLW